MPAASAWGAGTWPARRRERAGIARTYQTTQLFGSLSVLDNVLIGLRRGRLGNPLGHAATPAQDLPHVDRRLVEIARALATRPKVLLLDEPAAGLMRADKTALGAVLRKLAGAGLAVILVEHADRLLQHGVTCSLATNNVLNPFTPFGDGSLIRMANLYANIAQLGRPEDLSRCLDMITASAAKLMNVADYGVAVGHPADLIVLPCASGRAAVAEIARPLFGLKRGRRTFSNAPGQLHTGSASTSAPVLLSR